MQAKKELLIETKNGFLRGTIERSVENFYYCAFKGVPYAKPPINELRFKDPEPPENWTGIRDAKNYESMCAQFDPPNRQFGGSEDCLYLNLYVRSMRDVEVKKPVMVYIHGGAFMYCSSNDLQFGPDYLVRKDIILITFNYRLGIFGFLNLDDEIAPGNQGLKDQVMLLKWVQANVEKFGGDPNNVTLFGESAGSVSAHYLAMTPMTKGLFHKVILQSGVGINLWSRIPEPKKYAIQLCHLLGKQTYDTKEIFDFINSMSSEKLVFAQEKVRKSYDSMKYLFPFIPSVDDKSPNPIMPIPIELASERGIHVPCLVGYNNKEGTSFFIAMKNESFIVLDRHFSKIIDPMFANLLDRYHLTVKDLREMYFNNEKITQRNHHKLADLFQDWKFVEGIHRVLKIQAEKNLSTTYAYKFSYNEKYTLCKSLIPFNVDGATHFDEVEYLFFSKMRILFGLPALQKNTPSYRIMEQMTEMWTNFAIYGNPTPDISDLLSVEWLPINDGINLRFLNIDTKLRMETEENIETKFLAAKKK